MYFYKKVSVSNHLIVIPTYNELENIEKMLKKVFSLEKPFHVLIVDDNSPDGTALKVEELQKEYPSQLFIEKRKEKSGLGTAYIHGFKWALNKNYQHIFEMDCDFSHNPDDLIRLLEPIENNKADLTIGSRYCKGGKVKNWPIDRILMSYFASIYVRIILWISIKDTTAGFKCYHRKVLEKIPLESIPFKGYAFQICMKYATVKLGFRVKEVPITFIDREFGLSKMSKGIFSEAFFGVWKMKKIKF